MVVELTVVFVPTTPEFCEIVLPEPPPPITIGQEVPEPKAVEV
jgi:hypothetical protein